MDGSNGSGATLKGSSSGARRRRIVERGSDRLALITGRIKNLPSDSETESGSNQLRGHSYTVSCPPSISQIDLPSSDQSSEPLDSTKSVNKVLGSLPTNDGTIHEHKQSVLEGRTRPYIHKCDSSTEATRVASSDLDMRRQSSQLTSIVENPQLPTSNTNQHPRSCANKLVNLQDVSSSVAATEGTRTLCSLAMGIMVVFSYMGFPIVGTRILKNVISFRPLYLLLLTNVTIVIAKLLDKYRGLRSAEQQSIRSSVGEDGLFNQLGNVLEIGITLRNVMGALFMDCSIYSITVISCLSLAQGLSR